MSNVFLYSKPPLYPFKHGLSGWKSLFNYSWVWELIWKKLTSSSWIEKLRNKNGNRIIRLTSEFSAIFSIFQFYLTFRVECHKSAPDKDDVSRDGLNLPQSNGFLRGKYNWCKQRYYQVFTIPFSILNMLTCENCSIHRISIFKYASNC